MDEQRYQAILADSAKYKADVLADADRRRESKTKEAAFLKAVRAVAWEADRSQSPDERFRQWGAAFPELWRESKNTGRADRYRQLVEHWTRPECADEFYRKAAELLGLGASGDTDKIIGILRADHRVDYQLYDRIEPDDVDTYERTGRLRSLIERLRHILGELEKNPEDAIAPADWLKAEPEPIQAPAATAIVTAPAGKNAKPDRRVSIDVLMTSAIEDGKATISTSARQWTEIVRRSKASIIDSKTWATIMGQRAQQEVEIRSRGPRTDRRRYAKKPRPE